MSFNVDDCDDMLEEYYITMVFRGPRTSTDRIIEFCTGDRVHVDIGVFMNTRSDFQENYKVFSAYVKSSLSKTDIHENHYSVCNNADKAYAIKTTKEAATEVDKFLNTLYDRKLPYNHSDLLLVALPEVLTKTLPDVDLHNVESAFCSQLTILALRVMVQYEKRTDTLSTVLRSINSRTVSPTRVLRLLLPFMGSINLRDYLQGNIQYISF